MTTFGAPTKYKLDLKVLSSVSLTISTQYFEVVVESFGDGIFQLASYKRISGDKNDTTGLAGGWKDQPVDSKEAKDVAEFVLTNVVNGAKYNILTFASQVVSGMNYKITIELLNSEGKSEKTLVAVVYKPFDSGYKLTSVKYVEPPVSHLFAIGNNTILPYPLPVLHLSPPWQTLHSKINATIGLDKDFKILPLVQQGAIYFQDIISPDRARGATLAWCLQTTYPMGNLSVVVRLKDQDGNEVTPAPLIGVHKADLVVSTLKSVFNGKNPLFVDAIKINDNSVVLVILASVIQFQNDNGSDFYGNFNGVASDVFRDVINKTFLGGDVKLSFTTQKK